MDGDQNKHVNRERITLVYGTPTLLEVIRMTFEWVMTTLKSAMKQHMIDRDTVSLNVVRGLISALQNKNKELMGKEMT